MGRVKTFTNGGSLLPGDLNSIEDDYESGFAGYKTIMGPYGGYWLSGPATVNPKVFSTGGNGVLVDPTGAGSAVGFELMYLDLADYAAGTRTTKYRVRFECDVNATAVLAGITITCGLYPVTGHGGGAGVNTLTLGAVQAGSTIQFTAPGASTQNQGNSGDFNAPAAGRYTLAVLFSGNIGAGCCLTLNAVLQARQV